MIHLLSPTLRSLLTPQYFPKLHGAHVSGPHAIGAHSGELESKRVKCQPHSNLSHNTREATNWRREEGVRFAHERGLPVFTTWAQSLRSYDDHNKETAGDCRHWCNPGRTLYSQLERLVPFVKTLSGSGKYSVRYPQVVPTRS